MSEYLNLSHYPKDWAIHDGHTFLALGSGVSPSGVSFSPHGDTPYMKVDDFNNAENSTFIKVTKLRFDREGSRTPLANINAIIIAKRGAAIFKNRVRISQQIMAVDTNLMTISVDENHCHVYFKYLLEFINLGSIADTTSIPQLNNFHLNEATFAFPPLPEQQEIAAILTSVDEVIEKTQAQIDKLKDLKTAMMQTLLTNGVGTKQGTGDGESYIPHTEFKDSPVGRIPKSWDVVKLGDTGKWKGGGTPSKANKEFWSGSIPWVSPKDMKLDLISRTHDYVTVKAVKESSTNLIFSGSLLMVVRSGILQHTLPVAIAGCDVTVNQDMKALTVSDKYDTRFIFHYLKAHNHKVLRATLKTGNTVESIDFNEFSKYLIPSPPLAEQIKIANLVDSVANSIHSKTLKLKQTCILTKALMQDLLTGKVRVKVD